MSTAKRNQTGIEYNLKHKIFKHLSEEELNLVRKDILEVVYYEGETIFKQGTPITHIASITKGLVKLYIEGFRKKNLILQYSGTTDFFGGPGAFVDNLHHFSAAAIEETTANLISLELFKKLIKTNNAFALAYIEDISEKGIQNFERFISLTQKQMHGRIAEAILYYRDKVYAGSTNAFPLKRNDLAELTALSKDSTGRILKSFQESKLIGISESKLSILNRKELEKISQNG